MSDVFQTDGAVLLAASFGAALAYLLVFLRQPPSLLRTVFKTTPIAALAVFAWISGGPWLLIAALGFSALGDAALSRDGDRAFMVGLGAFLVAHVLYAPLFLGVSVGAPEGVRLLAAGAALIYTFIVARWLWPHLGEMRAPVAVYMAAILAMGVAAIMAPFAMWPILAGAALFILSDTVLAAETFVFVARPRRWTSPTVWVTYYGGQALIAAPFVFNWWS